LSTIPTWELILMAFTGVPPKAYKHGKNPNADWTDVADVPYEGPSPSLPPKCGRRKWHEPVSVWWDQVRRMPHCVLWGPTDWTYAIETCYMKQQLWIDYSQDELKSTLATEIRRREDQMGTTVEARRKLRIRYVDPSELAGEDGEVISGGVELPGSTPASVTSLSSRRARLTA
jgi:hypothetical protein